jgi:hypothetical protein
MLKDFGVTSGRGRLMYIHSPQGRCHYATSMATDFTYGRVKKCHFFPIVVCFVVRPKRSVPTTIRRKVPLASPPSYRCSYHKLPLTHAFDEPTMLNSASKSSINAQR